MFDFLTELAENNNKEWFDAHKAQYESAKLEATTLFKHIYSILTEYDTLSSLKIYRIHRDLRFSNDKTPYKTHFGYYIQRKEPYYLGGYYVCISPQETFIGGGFFEPNKDELLRIRKEISFNAEKFREVMKNEGIQKEFGGQLWGEELKIVPKGFEKDDPMIDYLRKKQFLLKHDYSLEEATSNNFAEKSNSRIISYTFFFDFMTEALTTNLNRESISNN
ncbi:DUF2461 domain-containing protein [Capnocytophaga leadbetteri]